MHTKTLLENLIETQKESLDFFYQNLNVEKLQSIFEQMCNAPTLFLTGVGKSAIIAKRLSQMCISIGKKASFLSSLDALHGDLGILDTNDVIVLFSKSGSTQELLDLIPFLKRGDAKPFAFAISKTPF